MSKAFAKEDVVDHAVVVPARAPLPPGVANYVTARGLALLRQELAALEEERARLEQVSDVDERARRLAIVSGRIGALAERIGSAALIDTESKERSAGTVDEVRFGATVTVRTLEGEHAGQIQRYTIVGVDEASASDGRVAFVSPLARAVLGRRVGETVSMATGRGEEELEIVAVEYGS